MVMSLMSNPKGAVATVIVAQDGSGDTTDVQIGLGMLPATGGCVYIKEGTYMVTRLQIPSNNISLIGCGRSTIITTTANLPIIESNGQDYVHIEKIYVLGSGAGALQDGIDFEEADHSKIVDCWVENCGDNGISLDTCAHTIINGCFVNTCGRNGIDGSGCTDAIIGNNIVRSNTSGGIDFSSSSYIEIIGNICDSNGTDGINIAGEFYVTSDNICIGNGSDGISVYNCVRNIIVNNLCNNNSAMGILLTGTSPGCDHNVISGNRCRDNANYEIRINTSECQDNLISGNVLIGTHVGSILDNGTNTQIFNNVES